MRKRDVLPVEAGPPHQWNIPQHAALHEGGGPDGEAVLQVPVDRRQRRLLWDDARIAKEVLSRTSQTTVNIPLADIDTIITREAFEQRAKPLLEQTIRTGPELWRIDPAEMLRAYVAGYLHTEAGTVPEEVYALAQSEPERLLRREVLAELEVLGR